MFGPPKDVAGECNARLVLGDDYGDNTCTFRCGLKPGHSGKHRDEFGDDDNRVIVQWDLDEREELSHETTT